MLRIDSSRIAGKPSRNRRPLPAIAGAITSLSSSTTPAASSAWATEMLARAGYEVANLAGGLKAWDAAGLPLEPPNGYVA